MTSIIKVDQIQNAAGGVPTAGDLGLNTTGTVLQVVTNSATNIVTNSSGNYVSELSTIITPKSSTSTLLVGIDVYLQASLAATWSLADMTIYDSYAADDITMAAYETGVQGVSSMRASASRTAYVDSVSTAPRTFSIRFRKHGGAYANSVDIGRRVMTITEIAG